MNRLKNILVSFLHYIKSCPRSILHLIRNRNLWSKKETYYPEAKYHKSSFCIFCEQLLCILKYGEINDFYFLYGFDTKNRKQRNEYIQHSEFRVKRNKRNYTPFNWANVLRDKELFAIVGESYGIPTIKTIGILKKTDIYYRNGENIDLIDYLSEHNNIQLFLKPLNDECGKGIFTINVVDGQIFLRENSITKLLLREYLEKLGHNEFIVQERLGQHAEMNRLYNKSLNTLRIITIRNSDGKPSFFDSLLRIGANDNVVDNWARGGLAVGVLPNGLLKKEAYFKPPFGKIAVKHPNSEVKFEGFKIPYYEKAVNLAINFHEKIKGVYAIGWDVSITKDGPVFVEGNDNFEISLHQACNKGMKKEIITLLK